MDRGVHARLPREAQTQLWPLMLATTAVSRIPGGVPSGVTLVGVRSACGGKLRLASSIGRRQAFSLGKSIARPSIARHSLPSGSRNLGLAEPAQNTPKACPCAQYQPSRQSDTPTPFQTF